MVGYLVNEAKLNVNAKDNSGDTALHEAAKFGHEGVVKYLLDGGADVTIRNSSGKDPLQLATEHEKKEIVALLKGAASKQRAKM